MTGSMLAKSFPGALLVLAASLTSDSPAHGATPPVAPLLAGTVGQGPYGTIKGRLVWGGAEAPPQLVLEAQGKASKDPAVCAANEPIMSHELEVDSKTKGVKHGFAYLVRPSGSNPDAVAELVKNSPTAEVDQVNCDFVPHAIALHQDQVLKFKSSDPVNHNVHLSPFVNAPFNLILAPNGEVEKQFVAERRPIPLVCDIHPWMKGWIMIFDHPFFAVTEVDGSFEIKGVPVGKHQMIVWQESVGYVTEGGGRGMMVEVSSASQATDVGEIKLDPAKLLKK